MRIVSPVENRDEEAIFGEDVVRFDPCEDPPVDLLHVKPLAAGLLHLDLEQLLVEERIEEEHLGVGRQFHQREVPVKKKAF